MRELRILVAAATSVMRLIRGLGKQEEPAVNGEELKRRCD